MRKRALQYKHRPNLKLRSKARPCGQTEFDIELRVCPVEPDTERGGEMRRELTELTGTLRRIIGGGYKLIQNKSGAVLRTKILLKNEADMVVLTMTYPSLICAAYRYV